MYVRKMKNMKKYVKSNTAHLIENHSEQMYHLPKLIIYRVIGKICIHI